MHGTTTHFTLGLKQSKVAPAAALTSTDEGVSSSLMP